MSQNGKHRGTVIFFSAPKGYGFLKLADGEPDLFVHFSEIQMDGYRKLEKDQVVEFEIGHGDKGPVATSVRVIG